MAKKTLLLVCLLLAVCLACACGVAANEDAASEAAELKELSEAGAMVEGNTIKIGIFEPASGENGAGGLQETLGIKYANSLYPTVSVNGEEYGIELVELDNQSDKDIALTAARQLVSQGIVGVIGSYGSGVSSAASEVFSTAEIPAVGASCTATGITAGSDWYFRVCFTDSVQGKALASYAIDEGYAKAALLYQKDDEYSSGLAGHFREAFTGFGGQIVRDASYGTLDRDFPALIGEIAEEEPDVIFFPCSAQLGAELIPLIREQMPETALIGGDAWENPEILSLDALGVVTASSFSAADEDNPAGAEFAAGFKEYVNSDEERLAKNSNTDAVSAVSALGYDAYMALYRAIEALDGKEIEVISSGVIRSELANLSADGVCGSLSFDGNGDAVRDYAYIEAVSLDTLESKQFSLVKRIDAEDME